MLDDELKAKIREVLYSRPPSDKELEEFSGVEHIRQLRFNRKEGNANKYDVLIFRWKIEKIVELSNGNEVIMNIIRSKPKGKDLALNAGVSDASISAAKANNSYGIQYYKLSYFIEQIAKAVDAG